MPPASLASAGPFPRKWQTVGRTTLIVDPIAWAPEALAYPREAYPAERVQKVPRRAAICPTCRLRPHAAPRARKAPIAVDRKPNDARSRHGPLRLFSSARAALDWAKMMAEAKAGPNARVEIYTWTNGRGHKVFDSAPVR